MLKRLFMKRLGKNQKGVTLVELMAVVVILGIIAGVAGAAVTGSFSKAKENTDTASVRIISDAVQRYVLEGKTTEGSAITIENLVSSGFLTSTPTSKTGTGFTIAWNSTSHKYDVNVTGAPSTSPSNT